MSRLFTLGNVESGKLPVLYALNQPLHAGEPGLYVPPSAGIRRPNGLVANRPKTVWIVVYTEVNYTFVHLGGQVVIAATSKPRPFDESAISDAFNVIHSGPNGEFVVTNDLMFVRFINGNQQSEPLMPPTPMHLLAPRATTNCWSTDFLLITIGQYGVIGNPATMAAAQAGDGVAVRAAKSAGWNHRATIAFGPGTPTLIGPNLDDSQWQAKLAATDNQRAQIESDINAVLAINPDANVRYAGTTDGLTTDSLIATIRDHYDSRS
jgi:hypothetical protein